MPDVLVLCPALKLDKSSDVNEEQPPNMPLMFVTCSVLKLDKFREIKEEQP